MSLRAFVFHQPNAAVAPELGGLSALAGSPCAHSLLALPVQTKQLLRSLWSDFNTIVDAAWNDPYLNALWCSVTSLTSHFLNNMDGTRSINKEAVSQLCTVRFFLLSAPFCSSSLALCRTASGARVCAQAAVPAAAADGVHGREPQRQAAEHGDQDQ